MDIQIRFMKEDDAESLYAIGKRCGLGSWSLDSYISEYQNSIARYIVLVVDGITTGYAGIWCVVDEAQVMNIGVLESHRGEGFGERLMVELLQLAQREGCLSMTLEVRENNLSAIGLYTKMGFETIAIREDYYPGHINGLFMRRCDLEL